MKHFLEWNPKYALLSLASLGKNLEWTTVLTCRLCPLLITTLFGTAQEWTCYTFLLLDVMWCEEYGSTNHACDSRSWGMANEFWWVGLVISYEAGVSWVLELWGHVESLPTKPWCWTLMLNLDTETYDDQVQNSYQTCANIQEQNDHTCCIVDV